MPPIFVPRILVLTACPRPLQIPRRQGAQAAVVALPRQVPHVVLAALEATGDHGGVRARCVHLLRLGGLMVSAISRSSMAAYQKTKRQLDAQAANNRSCV